MMEAKEEDDTIDDEGTTNTEDTQVEKPPTQAPVRLLLMR